MTVRLHSFGALEWVQIMYVGTQVLFYFSSDAILIHLETVWR